MTTRKNYKDLCLIKDYKGRLEYLMTKSVVGFDTFGNNRYLNQHFYRSKHWLNLRHAIISRDRGCDMGLTDYPISGVIVVHHIVPLTLEILQHEYHMAIDPDNLISVATETHKIIHFAKDLSDIITERKPGDTKFW